MHKSVLVLMIQKPGLLLFLLDFVIPEFISIDMNGL